MKNKIAAAFYKIKQRQFYYDSAYLEIFGIFYLSRKLLYQS